MSSRSTLEALLRAGLAAVDPEAATRRWMAGAAGRLRSRPLTVVAAGKAAGPMARALVAGWGERIVRGLVVTGDGLDPGPEAFHLERAGHPLPDERSARAGAAVLDAAAGTPPDGGFVLLLSGGASALLTAPADGLALSDLRAVTAGLMRAGADIEEQNAVRRHLTRASGGRLAAVTRALVEVAVVSDVPGDELATIGSGPCAPDPTTWADALEIVERRLGERVPTAVRAYLQEGAAGALADTRGSGDPIFDRVHHEIVARNEDALRGIEAAARERGIPTARCSFALEGEARDAATRLVAEARSRSGPLILLAGGETTVTVRGSGRGGRNQELALAAACELDGESALSVLAAGSDGIDGPTDAAGAWADGQTARRGRRAGVEAAACLEDNDAHRFFEAEGGLLRTGPTGTNVMDLVLVAVGDVGVAGDRDR